MDLKVIKGGGQTKIERQKVVEQVEVFKQHLRSIEESIVLVARMAETMGWDELLLRIKLNHHGILDTLGYIKKNQKEIITELKTKYKEPSLEVFNNEKE